MRSVFLQSENASKSGEKYKFKFGRRERDFSSFKIKTACVTANLTTTSTNNVEDSVIDGYSPIIWLDWSHGASLLPSGVVEGEDVTSIAGRGVAGVLLNASAANMKYSKINEMPCILSDINWHYWVDAVTPNPLENDDASLTMVFRTHDTSQGTNSLFRSRIFRPWANGNNLRVESRSGNYLETSLLIDEATDYLLQMQFTNGDTMKCILTNLLTDSTSDETVSDTLWNEAETDYNIFISYASTGFIGLKVGNVVSLNTPTAAQNLQVSNYMKARYNGVTTTTTVAPTPRCLKLCSEFLTSCKLGISVEKSNENSNALETLNYHQEINLKSYFKLDYASPTYFVDRDTLKDIDIFFEKPDGTVMPVDEFTLTLDFAEVVSQL